MGFAPTLRLVILTHSAATDTSMRWLYLSFGQALLIVVVALAPPLVLVAALLPSGSTSLLLSHEAFTTRQDIRAHFLPVEDC